MFSVEITQPPNGVRVSARGQSTRTHYPNDKKWQAVARVSGPRRLQPGPALATATATITLKNGKTEHYPWPVDVVLTDHVPPGERPSGRGAADRRRRLIATPHRQSAPPANASAGGVSERMIHPSRIESGGTM